jgi:large subunit ribosomal protein L4
MTTKKVKKEKQKLDVKQPLYNFLDAKEVRKIDLDEKIFDGNVNKALLHQVVIMYQAAKRAGTAATKTRGEVSGGGKKPWKQKGTGRARAGSIRSPLWKGGGAVFGPHPKDYSYEVPKKIKRQAVQSALNGKLLDSELLFIEEIKLAEPKTKIFASSLRKLLKSHTSVMFIVDKIDENLKRASRNVPKVLVAETANFNALDILLHKNLIVSESALKKIQKRIF